MFNEDAPHAGTSVSVAVPRTKIRHPGKVARTRNLKPLKDYGPQFEGIPRASEEQARRVVAKKGKYPFLGEPVDWTWTIYQLAQLNPSRYLDANGVMTENHKRLERGDRAANVAFGIWHIEEVQKGWCWKEKKQVKRFRITTIDPESILKGKPERFNPFVYVDKPEGGSKPSGGTTRSAPSGSKRSAGGGSKPSAYKRVLNEEEVFKEPAVLEEEKLTTLPSPSPENHEPIEHIVEVDKPTLQDIGVLLHHALEDINEWKLANPHEDPTFREEVRQYQLDTENYQRVLTSHLSNKALIESLSDELKAQMAPLTTPEVIKAGPPQEPFYIPRRLSKNSSEFVDLLMGGTSKGDINFRSGFFDTLLHLVPMEVTIAGQLKPINPGSARHRIKSQMDIIQGMSVAQGDNSKSLIEEAEQRTRIKIEPDFQSGNLNFVIHLLDS